MNPPWQPPDPKRFRPNQSTNDRQWIPPPQHAPIPHQPHVHPSRQSQLPPPPPPIAPYHQPHPQNLPPAPYYPPPQNIPPPYQHQQPPYYASHPQQPPPHSQAHSRRNKSSDPRQRPPTFHNHNNHSHSHNGTDLNHNNNKGNKDQSSAILDVLHISSDETKNFGDFAVTLSQIYGSRNIDGLPFGSSSTQSIEFDGRIRSEPILSFLPEAIETPSKKVRVYELSPLASRDARSYDELLAFFTKNERCPVVDKEYNMGILLYFVPPKLIFKKVDPHKSANKKQKNKKNKRKTHRINFMELLKLNDEKLSEDKLWMISIMSTSKYLLFKQKVKEKENEKHNKKNGVVSGRKKRDEAELSDIEISDDEEDESDNGDGNGMDDMEVSGEDSGDGKKSKVDDIQKSELIVALEQLYQKIGQKLPD